MASADSLLIGHTYLAEKTVYKYSISTGEWSYIYSATDGIGITAKGRPVGSEKAHRS